MSTADACDKAAALSSPEMAAELLLTAAEAKDAGVMANGRGVRHSA